MNEELSAVQRKMLSSCKPLSPSKAIRQRLANWRRSSSERKRQSMEHSTS